MRMSVTARIDLWNAIRGVYTVAVTALRWGEMHSPLPTPPSAAPRYSRLLSSTDALYSQSATLPD